MNSKLVILSGPSGSGKSTLEKDLASDLSLSVLVSHTTRAPRQGEIDGVNYHFVSKEEFDKLDMLEVNFYNGNWYGLSRQELNSKMSQGHCIVVMEQNGVDHLRENCVGLEAVHLFLMLFPTTSLRRMEERGDNPLLAEVRMMDNLENGEFEKWRYADSIVNAELPYEQVRFQAKAIVSSMLFENP